MRAIIYLRVSTDDQSLGIEAQRTACLEYCLKNGIQVLGEFVDEDLSGGLDINKRPGLIGAENHLKKGDLLLVQKRDRISRDVGNIINLEKKLNKKGCKLISAKEEVSNGTDTNSILMKRMLDTFAEHERNTIRDRTVAALAIKKSKGERVGHIPFGYQLALDGIHLEINENEQSIIRLMRKLQKSGMSIREIADNLNEKKQFNRFEKQWSKSACHRILSQKAA
jgi:DNA invertase Pin-like site-specific DNA recombinase